MLCKISGKMKLATTIFVVAFDMQETKKSPARGGARIILVFWLPIHPTEDQP